MGNLFREYLIPAILLSALLIIIIAMTVFFLFKRHREKALQREMFPEEALKEIAETEIVMKSPNRLLEFFKRYPLPSLITLILVIAVPAAAIFALNWNKEQKFDPRDFEYTSAETARFQRILNEAGNPGWGLLEYLSYSTRYVEDEETGETMLVVDGFLRNGYNKAITIESLELTVKTGDKKEIIAAAAFEDDYGEIPAKTSIKWRFNFTADYIENFSADLSKTYNILDYQINKVTD